MSNGKAEYVIAVILSAILLEIGFFHALCWYWSGFQWSPFGYETCGLESLVFAFFVWPAFTVGLLIRPALRRRWKIPEFVWVMTLIPCGIASGGFLKSLAMGIFCIVSMLTLPVICFYDCRKAIRKAPRLRAESTGPRPGQDGTGAERQQP